jgi:hypothetical protein
MQGETLGSAPALFRNFGCGAFCFIFSAVSVIPIDGIPQDGLRQIAEKLSPNFLLSSLVVIACYYVGVMCSSAGLAITWLLPNRYIEKQVELEADALSSGLSEIGPYIERWRLSNENSYTLAGVGLVLIGLQGGLAFANGIEVIRLSGLLLSISILGLGLGIVQIYAVTARFRALLLMVAIKQKMAPSARIIGSDVSQKVG